MSDKPSKRPSTLVLLSLALIVMIALFGSVFGFQRLYNRSRANRFEIFFGFQPEKEHVRQTEVYAHLKYKKKTCTDLLGQYVDAAKKESLEEFRFEHEAKRACENLKYSKNLAEEFGYRLHPLHIEKAPHRSSMWSFFVYTNIT